MRAQGPGEQFGVKLGGDKEWMGWVIENLHDPLVRGHAAEDDTAFLKGRLVVIVLARSGAGIAHAPCRNHT